MKPQATKILCAVIFTPCLCFFLYRAIVEFTNDRVAPIQGLSEAGINVLLAIFTGAMWWSFVRKEDADK